MTHRVLITCPNLLTTIDRYRDLFAQHDVAIDTPTFKQQLSEEELLDIIDQYDGVIAGDDPYTARVLQKGDRLKVVAKWGIGVDAIDLEAAKQLGIPVYNTPGAFSDEVADVAIGYIVLLARHLHTIDRCVRQGEWCKPLGLSLRGKTLGIVGVGNIGKAIARRGQVMGMELLGYDVAPVDPHFCNEVGLQQVLLNELLSEADFIVLCCALTQDNHHLLDAAAFNTMKHGVRIINVARGPLIAERALVQALQSGKVAGAALDVFECEPLPYQNPLRNFDNCIFGSHNSSNSLDAVLRVNELTIANLFRGLGFTE